MMRMRWTRSSGVRTATTRMNRWLKAMTTIILRWKGRRKAAMLSGSKREEHKCSNKSKLVSDHGVSEAI